tara:strand:+ start:1744 stop:2316 length:573 start_codon:yes stop_codon:yes gene_type:complete
MENEYYKTKESVDEYIKLAKGIDGRDHIKKLKTFLPLGSSLLEIGSGPGADWSILAKDYKTIGSDNSKEFLSHLNAHFPEGKFLELDALNLKTDILFDGIYSNKVLHHLNEDELSISIKKQHKILNQNAIICHSFWQGKGSEIFNGLFVQYHNPESLKLLFNGRFKILFLEPYTEFEREDSLLLIGQKIS